MTRVGATGHQRLHDPGAWPWVREELARALDAVKPPLVGLSALAAGTDQIFAEMILARDGTLELVLPFTNYRDVFRKDAGRASFDRLSALAARVWHLPPAPSRDEAYLLAGKLVVEQCDLVLAVYDGRTDTGIGSTGDVVEYATKKGVPLVVIDPVKRAVTRS
jgi:hypothetical protein